MPAFSSTGVIERVGDSDWFAVNLTGGQVYVLSSNQPGLALNIRNPFGEVIRAPFDPLFGGYAFRAPFGGNFYVEAGGTVFPGTLAFSGAYTVAVTSVDGDPIRGDTFTDRTIAPGENYMVSYPGIQAARTDNDWWAANLIGGRSYQATTNSGEIYIADASGRVIEIDVAGAVQFTPLSGGLYYFGVSPTGTQTYTIRLNEVTDDYADNRGTVGRISVGASAGGTLEVPGDEDWFQAQLDASQTYSFVTTGPRVSVYNNSGMLVAEDVVAFQPRQTGTFYVAAYDGTGPYSVGMTVATGALPGNTTTTATLVPGDGPRAAQLLGRGDEDWYRVSLVAGRSYAVSADPAVAIAFYDAGGNPVFGTPTGGDVRTFTPYGTGTFYVAVSTGMRTPTGYGISLATYTDDVGASFFNAGRIDPETVVNATFETRGDRDWFAVDLRSGTSYYLDGSAQLVLRDANGVPVTTLADRTFTAQFNGLYYVEAIGGELPGAYSFAVRSFADDYVDNVSTRGRLTEGGDNPTPPPPGGGSTTPTTGDDSITGTAGNDTIDALAGNDTIRGLGGDDLLTGGPGNDLIDGGSGSDTADYSGATAGVTVSLTTTMAQNTGGAGTDTLVSIENLRGGAGGDAFNGDDGANVLEDRLGGNDNLIGNGGDDTLTLYRAATDGPGLAYVVRGGEGNDTIIVDGNGGNDQAAIQGDNGADVVDLRDLGNTTVDLGAGNDKLAIDVRTGNYSVTLGTGSDTVLVLDRGTTPRLVGAIGITDFQGGTTGSGGDILDLRQYLLAVFPTYAPNADPYADGRLRLLDSTAGVQVQIDRDGAGTAFGFQTLLTLSNAQSVAVRDNIYTTYMTGGISTTPSSGDDSITGTAGNDTIDALAGNDTIRGLAGDDLLAGGAGNDLIDGGDGSDTADFTTTTGQVTVNLNVAGAQATGQGADTFVSIENIRGGAGSDLWSGTDFANVLEDRVGGNATITAQGGDDTITIFRAGASATAESYALSGGDGNDTISVDGNGANDAATIEGGLGIDFIDLRDLGNTTVDAGGGNDRVTIDVRTGNYSVTLGQGVDTIVPLDRGMTPRLAGAIGVTDFTPGAATAGGDTIDLRAYLAAIFPTYATSADPFADGRLRLFDAPAGVLVQIDRDGTGTGFGFETLMTLNGLVGSAGFTPNNILTGANGGGIAGTNQGDNLIGTGADDSIEGLGGNDAIQGQGGNDTLVGGTGDDTLMGGGGADRMEGGPGFDQYVVDDPGDLVVELRNGGFGDIVFSTISYTLPADAEVESLSAATATSTVGLALTGNAYRNGIAGTFGNDTLDGGGGSINGGDVLFGLLGDDSYTVDATNMLVIENANEGNDIATVTASGSGFNLTGNSHVETLRAAPGTANIDITGNLLSQRIEGNAGNNLLSTGGGGTDTLDGGLGDDIYRVHGQTVIFDAGGEDLLFASGSFRLTGAAQIELISTAVHLGTEAIDLIGNFFGQTIVGNYGANLIDGRSGNDVLVGLAGADTFRFSTNLGNGNVDQISDFVSGTDRIALASDVFAAVAGGVNATNFGLGSVTSTADQRILYDQSTGQLFYDSDGVGGQSQTLFAVLPAGGALTASDFIIVSPLPEI